PQTAPALPPHPPPRPGQGVRGRVRGRPARLTPPVPFFAPEEYRAGDLLLRSLRPGDGEELNRATVSSYEHLREFMDWARPDISVEESEEYARQSRAPWLLGEGGRLGGGGGGRG